MACRLAVAALLMIQAGLPLCLRAAQLGTRDTHFTIDGKKVFLLGCSYYGALGAAEPTIQTDLDQMKATGFNWIRVWATWAAFGNDVSAVDSLGRVRQPYMRKLLWLVDQCDDRGLIVNVTLSRGNGVTGPGRLQSLEAHTQAVVNITRMLKERQNWYLDLANERNIRDGRFVPFEELAQLRTVVRELDPGRLVTASHAGQLSQEELDRYLDVAKVDVLSLHRPREPQSPAQTRQRTRELLGWIRRKGRVVPLHYDEPFRRGFGTWEPTADDFLTDLQGAFRGGAAGWCFHNGDCRESADGRPRRSFDLRQGSLFEQLDGQEKQFLEQLKTEAGKIGL